jgi:hypothetical protein
MSMFFVCGATSKVPVKTFTASARAWNASIIAGDHNGLEPVLGIAIVVPLIVIFGMTLPLDTVVNFNIFKGLYKKAPAERQG